ncbi:restriction endonuclease subunit S [Fusobacterium nucleatum]|uniref:restriction endonuclease subunit S n=1 Tax=Fusobacterium nucleatum TaxID=851 RepID=UPI0030B2C718
MEYIKIKDILEFKKKSKIKASEGLKIGKYNFYTSSREQNKFLDYYEYSNEALIIGTGGNANIHHSYGKFSVSTDCFVLENKDNKIFLVEYIYKYLLKNIHILENGFRGAGLKHISKVYLENIEIPIISIEKQKKLIKNLKNIDIFIDKNKQIKNELNFLNKSLFTRMFGDIKSNDKNWKSLEIKEVSNILTRGKTPKYTSLSNIFVINQACIYWDKIKYENIKFHIEEENLLFLKNKDILINSTGTGTLGRMNIIKNIINEKFTVDSHVMLLRLKKEKASPVYFINIFMREEYQKELILKCVNGSTNQIELSKEKFSKLKIPVPPIELQNKFAERVEKIEKLSFIISSVIFKISEILEKKGVESN